MLPSGILHLHPDSGEWAASTYCYLRSLSPGGVLLKFTVVDGKIGPVVTTVPQRGKTAVTTDRRVAI